MVRPELIALFFVVGCVSSKPATNELPPPDNLINNANDYVTNTLMTSECGKLLMQHTPPEVSQAFPELQRILSDNTTDFCKLTFEKAFPLGCVVIKACEQVGVPPFAFDTLFAMYYGNQQKNRGPSDWFSCKDEQGNEKLGNIFKPEAYTPNYSFSNGVVNKQLPECPK